MSSAHAMKRMRSRVASDDQVVIGSFWMLASTVAVSAGSFLFWLIAARSADTDTIGRATGLFSVVFFLSYATNLGLPIAISRFGSSSDDLAAQRFRLAFEASIVSSAMGAAIFLLADPRTLLAPVFQRGSLSGWLVVIALTVGIAVSILVDVRLMGLRRWKSVFARSSAIAIVRIPPLLWAVSDDSGFWIFVVAVGGYAVTALPYVPLVLRGGGHPDRSWQAHGYVVTYSAVNYVSQLAVQAPLFVTPLVVALSVESADNATFYLSWGIMTVVYLGIHLLGRTLLVEGSRAGAALDVQSYRVLAIALAVAIGATIVSLPAGPLIEAMYGNQHDEMSTLLPLLMAGTIPWALTRTCLAIARSRAATRENLVVAAWSAVTALSGVALGGLAGGAVGSAAGWAVGCAASLLVAVPVLFRQLGRSS